MAYSKSGPFTNGVAPAFNASFGNNVENFLAGMFVGGNISRIAQFSGSGSGLFNHNLGATPDMCLIGYAGNFSISTLQPITWWSPNSTQVNVNVTGSFSWVGLALKF